MIKLKYFLFVFALLLLSMTEAMAQFPVVNSEDLKARMSGSKKILLVDTRPADEYTAGHLPGAVNIPLERMQSEGVRLLPKDKSVPVIFYCRGAG